MLVQIIDITEYTVLIQYEDASNHLQRCFIPRELLPVSIKGRPAEVPEEFIAMSIPYSNVDLVSALGETVSTIQVRDLENQLRRAGLWTREDYQKNPKTVQNVLQRIIGLDATTILNAAARDNVS